MNLDRSKLEIQCPRCSFFNPIRYRDARLRDVVICRGCKSNIQLDDHMNECRKARRVVEQAMAELQDALAGFSKNLTIKL